MLHLSNCLVEINLNMLAFFVQSYTQNLWLLPNKVSETRKSPIFMHKARANQAALTKTD